MQAENRSKAFYTFLRRKLKETNVADLAKRSGVKANTLSSFALGRSKGLTEATNNALISCGFIIEGEESIRTACPPLPTKPSVYKTVKEVQEEKGYSPATVRKYAREGVLDYFLEGKTMLIAAGSKYNELPDTPKKVLEKRILALEKENAELKFKLEEKEAQEKWENGENETQGMEKEFKTEPEYAKEGVAISCHRGGCEVGS